MAMKGRVGVGIVGLSAAGGWACRAHVPALHVLDQYELRAFAGSTAESAVATADHFGLERAYSSAAELAADDAVDLVLVAVKARSHAASLLEVIPSGKMVVCEWPYCRNLDEATEALAAADARNTLTAVGLQARHSPWVRFVRDLIAEGRVGDVLSTTLVASTPFWGNATRPATGMRTCSIHTTDRRCCRSRWDTHSTAWNPRSDESSN